MLRFCGWHSKGCERATRAIGGVQSSMRATTVIMRYCDQPASRVGIRLVDYITIAKVQEEQMFMIGCNQQQFL